MADWQSLVRRNPLQVLTLPTPAGVLGRTEQLREKGDIRTSMVGWYHLWSSMNNLYLHYRQGVGSPDVSSDLEASILALQFTHLNIMKHSLIQNLLAYFVNL